jgi:ubiquinone/menaquinone biosynthesis C-methylase UbiE
MVGRIPGISTQEHAVPDYQLIYRTQAAEYDRLIAREDFQRSLWPALDQIRRFDGLDVVELGAGTGRLTRMFAPVVKSILATDIAPHMLNAARAKLAATGLDKWALSVADNRRLPVRDKCADVSVAGWSLGHFTDWYSQSWRHEIDRALAEMWRVLRPGGTVILVETLGTGDSTPRPPNLTLAAYYALLETERGFSNTWVRTDYRFESLVEAQTLVRFFFGDELADRVAKDGTTIVPECTGIWWKHKEAD